MSNQEIKLLAMVIPLTIYTLYVVGDFVFALVGLIL